MFTVVLPAVIDRLRLAFDRQDLDALAECLEPDYVSTHPAHPDLDTRGRDAACRRWAVTFACLPGLRAELLRWAGADDAVWTEWLFTARAEDGSGYRAGGVMIFGLANDRIAWARAFNEPQPIVGPDWDHVFAEALAVAENGLTAARDDLSLVQPE